MRELRFWIVSCPCLQSEWQSLNPGLSGSTFYALSLETGCLCENVQLAGGCCPAQVRLVMQVDSHLIKGSFVSPCTLLGIQNDWQSILIFRCPAFISGRKPHHPAVLSLPRFPCLVILAVWVCLRVHWRRHGDLSHLCVLSITQHRVWLRGRAREHVCQMNEWRDGWITSGWWVRLRLA